LRYWQIRIVGKTSAATTKFIEIGLLIVYKERDVSNRSVAVDVVGVNIKDIKSSKNSRDNRSRDIVSNENGKRSKDS
jgi:uncharacterized GH25 family protein